MDCKTILHIPLSNYAHAIDKETMVIRLRAGRNELTTCTLYYGDRSCRQTPVEFTSVAMKRIARDEMFDYYEAEFQSLYRRICYYFELEDGVERKLYYGDLFVDDTVEDRFEYFQFPYMHREDTYTIPEWAKSAIVYNIFPDSFATREKYISSKPTVSEWEGRICNGRRGGTIVGILENLEYIRSIGFNTIYLNPIFVAGEYHKYDLVDYYHIDPCFGTNQDFKDMVSKAHSLGIRVIIDGVFNHVGWNFWAFDDVVIKGKESPYVDWFYRLEFPVVKPQDIETYPTYECFGYERMMPKINTGNYEVQNYFYDVCKYWIEEFDIDGWRLDVASEVDDGFWRGFLKTAKEAKEDIFIIGEVWEGAMHWINKGIFHSTMNYDLRKHCNKFIAKKDIDAGNFATRITNMLWRYNKNLTYGQLNLLDSHDVSRFLTLCDGNKESLKLALVFMYTFVGIPCVFYGDEKSISGLIEDEYRLEMQWDYEDELEGFLRVLSNLRQKYSVLSSGEMEIIEAEKDSTLFGYRRFNENDQIAIYINTKGNQVVKNIKEDNILFARKYENQNLGENGFVIFKSE